MTVGWRRVGSRAEEPHAKSRGQSVLLSSGQSKERSWGRSTQLGREFWGRARAAGWVVAPASFRSLKARLHLQRLRKLGRCGEWCGWYAETPHPLSLGRRTGLTSLFDSSGHSSFLSSFPPQRIGISVREVLTFMTRGWNDLLLKSNTPLLREHGVPNPEKVEQELRREKSRCGAAGPIWVAFGKGGELGVQTRG